VFKRLGIQPTQIDVDIAFVMKTFEWLESAQVPWPQFWHDWSGGGAREGRAKTSPNAAFYTGDAFQNWLNSLARYTAVREGPIDLVAPSLLYEDIGALWTPIDKDDNWSAFHAKLESFTPLEN